MRGLYDRTKGAESGTGLWELKRKAAEGSSRGRGIGEQAAQRCFMVLEIAGRYGPSCVCTAQPRASVHLPSSPALQISLPPTLTLAADMEAEYPRCSLQ